MLRVEPEGVKPVPAKYAAINDNDMSASRVMMSERATGMTDAQVYTAQERAVYNQPVRYQHHFAHEVHGHPMHWRLTMN